MSLFKFKSTGRYLFPNNIEYETRLKLTEMKIKAILQYKPILNKNRNKIGRCLACIMEAKKNECIGKLKEMSFITSRPLTLTRA